MFDPLLHDPEWQRKRGAITGEPHIAPLSPAELAENTKASAEDEKRYVGREAYHPEAARTIAERIEQIEKAQREQAALEAKQREEAAKLAAIENQACERMRQAWLHSLACATWRGLLKDRSVSLLGRERTEAALVKARHAAKAVLVESVAEFVPVFGVERLQAEAESFFARFESPAGGDFGVLPREAVGPMPSRNSTPLMNARGGTNTVLSQWAYRDPAPVTTGHDDRTTQVMGFANQRGYGSMALPGYLAEGARRA